MSRLEREIQIDASAEAVYDKLTDPTCLADWVTIHDALEEGPDGNVEPGDTLVQRMKIAGRKVRIRWHVDEAERPSRVVWTGKGPFGTKAKAIYEIQPRDGDGTVFSYVNEYDLPGGPAGKLVGRAILGTSGPEADRSLERLKALVEKADGGTRNAE